MPSLSFDRLPVVEEYQATPTSLLKTEGSYSTIYEVIGAGSQFYDTKAEIKPHNDLVAPIFVVKDPTGYGFYELRSETELPSCFRGRWTNCQQVHSAVETWLEGLSQSRSETESPRKE